MLMGVLVFMVVVVTMWPLHLPALRPINRLQHPCHVLVEP